ncbi:hypothetical protein SDC9_90425 [bioreactor metagenome]|uniref:Uncharacterized protein n=1 Tax=bioreactor metagenome TaxID=1076179 RepID=A0A644ZTN3_9ZZZZ
MQQLSPNRNRYRKHVICMLKIVAIFVADEIKEYFFQTYSFGKPGSHFAKSRNQPVLFIHYHSGCHRNSFLPKIRRICIHPSLTLIRHSHFVCRSCKKHIPVRFNNSFVINGRHQVSIFHNTFVIDNPEYLIFSRVKIFEYHWKFFYVFLKLRSVSRGLKSIITSAPPSFILMFLINNHFLQRKSFPAPFLFQTQT